MELFCVDLRSIKVDLNYYRKFLSTEEKTRFDKITNLKAKRNFACARFLIRSSLAKILKCQPEEVLLKINDNGRPELLFPKLDLNFNVSHSGDYIVLAINNGEVGIDVEQIKDRNFLGIAEDFFSKNEFEAIKKAASDATRKKLFYQYWTAKEAFVKCKSLGIFDKVGEIDLEKKIVRYLGEEYNLSTVDLAEDYVMSVVWKGFC